MQLSLRPIMNNAMTFKDKIDAKGLHFAKLLMPMIDFFYPPFRKLIPHQTFRYAACGGANQTLNLLIYFLSYNYLFQKQVWDLGFVAFEPHIAAFIVAFIVTFPIGFLLARYVVFSDSAVKGRKQARGYFIIAGICIILNYFLLKFFVEVIGWYPTPSMLLTIFIVVGFSYVTQKKFAFKSVG